MTARIIVKKNLIIFEKEDLWTPIRNKIVAQHGLLYLISTVTKRELGFTTRQHQQWITVNKNNQGDDIVPRGYLQNQIHLDFYDAAALTWFQLKYL
jgi:hypothetical protein